MASACRSGAGHATSAADVSGRVPSMSAWGRELPFPTPDNHRKSARPSASVLRAPRISPHGIRGASNASDLIDTGRLHRRQWAGRGRRGRKRLRRADGCWPERSDGQRGPQRGAEDRSEHSPRLRHRPPPRRAMRRGLTRVCTAAAPFSACRPPRRWRPGSRWRHAAASSGGPGP